MYVTYGTVCNVYHIIYICVHMLILSLRYCVPIRMRISFDHIAPPRSVSPSRHLQIACHLALEISTNNGKIWLLLDTRVGRYDPKPCQVSRTQGIPRVRAWFAAEENFWCDKMCFLFRCGDVNSPGCMSFFSYLHAVGNSVETRKNEGFPFS